MSDHVIREAQPQDCAAVLKLMRALADFEGYLKGFAVTLEQVKTRFLDPEDVGVLVADLDGEICGILVYYFLPVSFDMKPWMVVKELFVDADHRGSQMGEGLMHMAASICKNRGGSKIKWEVLASNHAAKNFYLKLGGQIESDWQTMSLKPSEIKTDI